MRCELMVGRLISHPCGAKGRGRCSQCGRAACARHAAGATPGVCVQCAGLYQPPGAPVSITAEEMFRFTPDELARFEADDGPADHTLRPYDS